MQILHTAGRSSIALVCLLSLTGAQSPTTWTQTVEPQPTQERGAPAPRNTGDAVIADVDFHSGSAPQWIWGEDNNQSYVLTTTFMASGIQSARLMASCDNVGTVFINGKQVATSSEWQEPMSADVSAQLVGGANIIEAEVANRGGVAAFVLKLALRDSDGSMHHVVTDASWTVSSQRGQKSTQGAFVRGTLGDGPWGNVFDNAVPSGRVPNGTFEVLPGFQVERLFTVPKDELGSWVCIAFDNKDRLLASDQGDKGIVRITLPPLTSSDDNTRGDDETPGETIVERLDFSRCRYQPSGAQGMLWAFDSLYFCCNGGPGSGLYRARDTDGDDQFDECERLKDFRGGGEHGPHAIRLSPDGQRIFVIAGNHTQPPFNAGEELQNDQFSSRIPTTWDEDLLLPRMWDANGHARGILAPGGWIASTDPEGKSWDIWSIGYRNPYDMAFNADGELFAYDADMEWDVGLPWYRPTRVVHATSGSEFGWRSGSGKWPDYYIDSLPPLVEIGPGSPVGIDFGYGLKFPEKYQQALYICDWTFGTMYAIHLQPELSSYRATKEEFVARNALPLTDVVAGPDGALYFTVGGRGTQSELFRVTYVGDQSTAPANPHQPEFAADRRLRRFAESFHGSDVTLDKFAAQFLESPEKLEIPEPEDLAQDRVLMMAAHRLFQGPDFAKALLPGFLNLDKSSSNTIDFVVAMTRGVERNGLTASDLRSPALAALQLLPFAELEASKQLDYLRALSLVFLRLGEPSDEERLHYCSLFEPVFPTDDWRVNRELCQMLVYLQSSVVVDQTVKLLDAPSQPTVSDDLTDLLARNRGYGNAIAAAVANAPDQQQIWYAYCLRVADNGWTLENRDRFYRWFTHAKTWSGGNSFRKFLQNMEDEAWSKTPENQRVLLEAAGARQPYVAPELPKPTGPGKDWTIEEIRAMAVNELKQRDFENGQSMFAAARCVLCHRFAGDGGATGPDLTQLAGRFSVDALTEAIMDPAKVVSDQYKGSIVVTTDGKSVNGRIISETDLQISVLTDPEDSTKIADVLKSDIDEILPSTVSIMPADLLKTLNKDEVLDLLAYLLSRGDKSDPMFRK